MRNQALAWIHTSGPIQVASTLGDCLQQSHSKLFQQLPASCCSSCQQAVAAVVSKLLQQLPASCFSSCEQAVSAVASKLSGTQPRLYQSLYALKEFAAHLLDLHSPGMELGFEILTLTNLDKRGEIFLLMK